MNKKKSTLSFNINKLKNIKKILILRDFFKGAIDTVITNFSTATVILRHQYGTVSMLKRSQFPYRIYSWSKKKTVSIKNEKERKKDMFRPTITENAP